MKLAFILDPLEGLKVYKDSSVAMMRVAAKRGHEVWAIQRTALIWRDGSVAAHAQKILPTSRDEPWFALEAEALIPLTAFDAVLMRQDPPFDFEYVAATWLLERAEAEGARIWNKPRSIRDHSEKVAITEFPQYTPTTLIARDPADIHAFIDELGDVILKPLDGMGGSSIFRVLKDDPNRNVIVETLTNFGARSIMAQRYLPAIAQGDKRILLIAGEPVPQTGRLSGIRARERRLGIFKYRHRQAPSRPHCHSDRAAFRRPVQDRSAGGRSLCARRRRR